MPPKTSVTREMVLGSSLDLVRENGLSELTARNIAQKLGCSTAPIYSTFSNMEELENEVMDRAKDLLVEYSQKRYTDQIFLNQGIGIAFFARDHPALYRELFMETSRFVHLHEEMEKELFGVFSDDDHYTDLPEGTAGKLREKMWIFTHGLASLSCAGLLPDDSDEFIIDALYETGRAVIRDIMDPCEGEKIGEGSPEEGSSTKNNDHMMKKVMR